MVFQMQRAGLQPDVVSYALLINAYGKARREEEALAVFEEMLDAGIRCVRSTCVSNLNPTANAISLNTCALFLDSCVGPMFLNSNSCFKNRAEIN